MGEVGAEEHARCECGCAGILKGVGTILMTRGECGASSPPRRVIRGQRGHLARTVSHQITKHSSASWTYGGRKYGGRIARSFSFTTSTPHTPRKTINSLLQAFYFVHPPNHLNESFNPVDWSGSTSHGKKKEEKGYASHFAACYNSM
ncbi:hypothetical protein CDAR_513431 [Caerostris darwini]|uniref:Ribosomal protein L2 n=1 Tax=Caerostris darwini TaxID=1538125 RepID=A0AAV4WWL8_9ARAC|nr:hypothetical protein CDAR_513431 [Caerostris darwini]